MKEDVLKVGLVLRRLSGLFFGPGVNILRERDPALVWL